MRRNLACNLEGAVGNPSSPRVVRFSNSEHLAKRDPPPDSPGRGGDGLG